MSSTKMPEFGSAQHREGVFNPMSCDGSLETVLACDRALQDCVKNSVRNLSFSVRPFEPTASERYIYRILWGQREKAKIEHMKRLQWEFDNSDADLGDRK